MAARKVKPALRIRCARDTQGWRLYAEGAVVVGHPVQLYGVTARDALSMIQQAQAVFQVELELPDGLPKSRETKGESDGLAPDDTAIRRELKLKLQEMAGKEELVLWDEFTGFGGWTRLDLAAITPSELVTYEIKSGRDTLERLPGQVGQAETIADRAYLVLDGKHFDEALEIIPSWWGVWLVEATGGKIGFQEVRQGQINPNADRGRHQAGYLYRGDALAEVRALVQDKAVYRLVWQNAYVAQLQDYLRGRCSDAELGAMGRRALMKRGQGGRRLGEKNKLIRANWRDAQAGEWGRLFGESSELPYSNFMAARRRPPGL